MDDVHCVDMRFEALRPIWSLPPFHGARWSAWLRFACAHAGLCADDMLHALLPLRNGSEPIRQGERLTLRLLIPSQALPVLPRLVRAMLDMPPRGEFSGRSLHFAGFQDGIDGSPVQPGELTPQTVAPLSAERLAERIEAVRRGGCRRLTFITPLRLTLPAGEKKTADGVRRFCDADFFRQGNALTHLLGHIRLLPPVVSGAEMRVERVRLHWADLRYSRERAVALGGLVGEICLTGRPDAETARRLVLGEYLGSGKNARFGLGFWRLTAEEGGYGETVGHR